VTPPTSNNSSAMAMQVPQSPMSMMSQLTDERDVTASPRSQRVGRLMDTSSYNTTPKDRRSRSQMSLRGSIGKRSGTPAVEYLRWNSTTADSPYTPSKSFEQVTVDDDDDLDFELHQDTLSDDGGFEGLENVRACCDGKHTVGGHHHHHHHHHPIPGDHLEVAMPPEQRPSSPAWSFRSRAGSAGSHDFFSGKLRFGSKRSTKTLQPSHDS
jgi:hypothetical protein